MGRKIISIVLIVLGGIVSMMSAMLLIVVNLMQDSIGAYYIRDMIGTGTSNPYDSLIIGVILIVIGILLLIFRKRRTTLR